MLREFWFSLEKKTQKTILIVSPVVILGFITLLDIHPLLNVISILLTTTYVFIFFAVELIREFIGKLQNKVDYDDTSKRED
ncbi:hypothetical protein [Bacillus gobiensis]|uniref:hypothetical protein n=1 Tax=Bacillus gobiensis TaxID=1441095 RepID=UPI003D238E42